MKFQTPIIVPKMCHLMLDELFLIRNLDHLSSLFRLNISNYPLYSIFTYSKYPDQLLEQYIAPNLSALELDDLEQYIISISESLGSIPYFIECCYCLKNQKLAMQKLTQLQG